MTTLRPSPTLAALALAAGLVLCAVPASAADSRSAQYYEDALQRYEKQDYAGAIIQLKNALKIDNQQLTVQLLLGKALLANGEVQAAEVAFNEAQRLGVNRAEIVVPLARTLIGQARLQEVVAPGPRFDPAGLPPPMRRELLLVQAAAHSDLGSVREATKAIEEARAIDPNVADSWLAEVPIQIRAQRFKEANAAADRALALKPNDAQAIYLKGSIAHAQGSVPAALAAYERTIALQPTHLDARLGRAGLLLDMNRVDDAAHEVAEARRLAPRDPRPAYLTAQVAERRSDSKGARAALAEVTSLLDPVPMSFMRYRPQVMMLGGLAHFGLGQNEKAKPYLEGVVRQQPDAPAAKLLAQIHLADKNHDRAIETLEVYLRSHGNDVQAVVLLATAQIGKGRASRAVQLLQEALKTQDAPRLHSFLGLTLAGTGKTSEAIAELEKGYRKDPSDAAAGAALIDLYLRRKQNARALEIAEAIAKRSPNEAQYQTLLGHARAQAGDAARSRAAYEAALKLDPRFVAAQLGLARLDGRERQDDAAVRRLSAILAQDERNVEALMESAYIAERRGQAAEAVRLMTKASDFSLPPNQGAALALVELHLRQARPELALEAVKKLEAKTPDNPDVMMAGARARLAARDLKPAQTILTRASRLSEAEPAALVPIALLQMAADDPRGALYTASKALQADPAHLPAKALTVDANLRLGDTAAAEQAAREIAQRHPKLALSAALQGDVAAARKQWPAALDAYRRALQLEPTTANAVRLFRAQERQNPKDAIQTAENWLRTHPGDVPVRGLLAAAHARAGNLPQARAAYEALVASAPDDADALNNLANVMLLQKDPKALPVAEKALALKPGTPYIIGTAGWAAHHAGQGDRALQLLRDARLRDPSNAETRYFLGVVLASKGRHAEAREELRGAMAAGPGFVHAKAAQALLDSLN